MTTEQPDFDRLSFIKYNGRLRTVGVSFDPECCKVWLFLDEGESDVLGIEIPRLRGLVDGYDRVAGMETPVALGDRVLSLLEPERGEGQILNIEGSAAIIDWEHGGCRDEESVKFLIRADSAVGRRVAAQRRAQHPESAHAAYDPAMPALVRGADRAAYGPGVAEIVRAGLISALERMSETNRWATIREIVRHFGGWGASGTVPPDERGEK